MARMSLTRKQLPRLLLINPRTTKTRVPLVQNSAHQMLTLILGSAAMPASHGFTGPALLKSTKTMNRSETGE